MSARIEATTHPLWQYIFGNAQPVEVEIGCGSGVFFLRAAADYPGTNWYGIERQPRRARPLAELCAQRALSNTHVLCADGACLVSNVIPDASVTAYHIYFPDPWWKRRHFGRRYFTPEFAAALERTLVPGGRLHLATDVAEVMQRMLEAVRTSSRLERRPDLHSPRVDRTKFELKGLERGAVIEDAVFQKSQTGPTD